jgi:CheY-like chemotaxis protein
MIWTVLVVEDEPIIRMNAVAMIEDAGYDVIDASNADEAIIMLETRPEIRVVLF